MKIIALALIATMLLLGCTQPPNPPGGCTKDAKICPDGSAVGRVAPSCEFAACPTIIPTTTATPGATDDIPPLPDEGNLAGCKTDADCAVGGCNGEACLSKEDAGKFGSICVYKPEFACYKQISCGCIEDACAWQETPEFRLCVSAARQGSGGDDLPPLPV